HPQLFQSLDLSRLPFNAYSPRLHSTQTNISIAAARRRQVSRSREPSFGRVDCSTRNTLLRVAACVEIIMRSILLPLLGLVVSIAAHAQSSEIPNRPIAELALSNDTMQVRYASSGGAVGVERSKFS